MMKNCDSDDTNRTDNNSSCDIKTHKAVKVAKKENTNAKNRWKLLARAILSNNKREMKIKEKLLPMSDVSQVFSGFDLVSVEQLRKEGDAETFTIRVDGANGIYDCSVHIEKLWTMRDLIGFNNTGNVAFWTSEAALTYFVLDNLQLFDDSWVLELGGGMFCLSGLMLAKYGNAFAVHLSDGNESSVNNVRNSIALNTTKCFVKTTALRWETAASQCPREQHKYDCILCADCLFFDESRSALVDSINYFLADGGKALVMAPKRGKSMNLFIKKCMSSGLHCEIFTYYNKEVWDRHQKLRHSPLYNEDIHYPILIKLSRMKASADYWKSQDRKFCDYCKCWITDNKASVDFHNNGKRHQANVQKRLNEIGKKSESDRKEKFKNDALLRSMNDAAMQSYAQDVAAGADFSSKAINRSMSKKAVDPIALAHYDSDEERGPSVSRKSAAVAAAAEVKDPSLWCEAKTEDGDIYYWNVKTNESKWTKPKEGYMSLKEYEKLNEVAIQQQKEYQEREMKEVVENADEIASKLRREQLKKYQKVTAEPKPDPAATTSTYADVYGVYASEPLGKWEAVEVQEEEPVDLELPEQEETYIAITTTPDEPPVKKFKEKVVTSLADETDVPSFFKKRKIGSRNIRRGNDDD